VVTIAQFHETLPGGKVITILKKPHNGTPIDPSNLEYTADDTPVFEVPPHHYFMMGDNRDNSTDSRFAVVRYVPEENIVGRAEMIFFSTDGTAQWINPISWVKAMRFDRFFSAIH
jgi:signal peptidase I